MCGCRGWGGLPGEYRGWAGFQGGEKPATRQDPHKHWFFSGKTRQKTRQNPAGDPAGKGKTGKPAGTEWRSRFESKG